MSTVQAYAAPEAGAKLEPFNYELGDLPSEAVDIKVHYCGICHSDLSMINNDWGMTEYPFVAGHEVGGDIIAAGPDVKGLAVGEKVGLGWHSASCMHCTQCMGGSHHLCQSLESTIVGRHGGFADMVRAHWSLAIKLPEEIDLP